MNLRRLSLPAAITAGSSALLFACVGDTPITPPFDAGGPADSAAPDTSASPDSSAVDSGGDAFDAGPPPTGNYLSSVVLPDITIGGAVAFGSNGDALLAGDLSDSAGTVNINGLGYTSAGGLDILAFKLAPNDGFKWVQRFGGTSDDRAFNGVQDSAGNAYVVGWVYFVTGSTVIPFGSTSLTAKHIGYSSYVLKLDAADGHPIWVTSFDSANGTSSCGAVAVNATGVAVSCSPRGDITFTDTSNTPHTVTHKNATIDDIFLAELDPTSGKVQKSAYIVGGSGEFANKLTYDSAGDLYAVGAIQSSTMDAYIPATSGSIAFTVTRKGTNPSASDTFALKLATSTWSHVWDQVYGAASQSTVGTGASLDSAGNLYIAGHFQGSEDFGTGTITAAGAADGYIIKLDPSGKTLAATNFGGSGSYVASTAVAVDKAGNVVTAGYYEGMGTNLKIGSTTLPTSTGNAWVGYTTKFKGDLSAPLWAQSNACPAASSSSNGIDMTGVDVDPVTGQVGTTGSLIGTTDFGDGKQVTRSNGLFFVRRSP